MRAENQFAGHLGGVHAHPRLEPLPLGIDERDESDRAVANPRGQGGEYRRTPARQQYRGFDIASGQRAFRLHPMAWVFTHG